MPSSIESRRQQLRTEIARSRRRLDRQARRLLANSIDWIPPRALSDGRSGWPTFITLVAGLALSRWAADHKLLERWRDQLLGHSAFQWLDRLLRQARVALMRLRHSSRSGKSVDEELRDE